MPNSAGADSALSLLSTTEIVGADRVREVLERVAQGHVTLFRGLNRAVEREAAQIVEYTSEGLLVELKGFGPVGSAVSLTFSLGGRDHYFSSEVRDQSAGNRLEIEAPKSLFVLDRRERVRRRATGEATLVWPSAGVVNAQLLDESADGLAVAMSTAAVPEVGTQLRVRLDGVERTVVAANVRRAAKGSRLGLSFGAPASVSVDIRERVLDDGRFRRLGRNLSITLKGAVARLQPHKRQPLVEVDRFSNEHGEEIVGLVDRSREGPYDVGVVIPPAWGRTKESLLPLARTLVESLERRGVRAVAYRFDGIRRRGESFNEPQCRAPGLEHHRFSVSQGAADLTNAIKRVQREYRPSALFVASFSAAALDARRAIAEDNGRLVDGWISVVGAVDFQSSIRAVSGGIDYLGGAERGASFGLAEVLGLEIDIDHATRDAMNNNLGFLADARMDFERIAIPITWIHGQQDAWMHLDRTLDALGHGDTSNRRVISIPCGHQLRSSREALDTFELIAGEVARMTGARGHGCVPNLAELSARQLAERSRRPSRGFDARAFWRDYLLGGEGNQGIELMLRTRSYADLISKQFSRLEASSTSVVVDLGSGTGGFRREFGERLSRVIELDYVPDALSFRRSVGGGEPCVADLASGIPLASCSVDCVLASLVVSYVHNVEELLLEARRILKPGGRIVVSSLKRDADLSKVWHDEESRLLIGALSEGLGEFSRLREEIRGYLNRAARVLTLEDEGRFRFYDPQELKRLLRASGFIETNAGTGMGSPAQASIAWGCRAR